MFPACVRACSQLEVDPSTWLVLVLLLGLNLARNQLFADNSHAYDTSVRLSAFTVRRSIWLDFEERFVSSC